MQRAVQVPSALILALNGLVVVFVVSSDRLRRRLLEADKDLTAGRAPPEAETSGTSPPEAGEGEP
jgi:simple sugar transport system permease protein